MATNETVISAQRIGFYEKNHLNDSQTLKELLFA